MYLQRVNTPPKIDLLPEHLIDQIKAGEVIERPGNLIKEIMENALDAGANKIELTIKNNGLDLISLKDNGHGMKYSDLPLAFSRHATSKISRFEDLYKLSSFGFRGEALASICAISKLQCISKTHDAKNASEIRIEGAITVFHGERQTAPFLHGTELVIQDLFFNTPARLKFIQSQQTEKTFIKKIVYAFILSRPEVEFQIKFEDADKDIFPGRDNLLDRIKDIYPKARETILYSERFYENYELEIFLVPGVFKGPFKVQNIFINNRYILDKQLHRVMTNGLEASFGNDDFHYIASFALPPDSIDVNVHPNKTIIKVLEMSKMISLLSSTIKELASKRPAVHPVIPTGAANQLQPPILPHGLLLDQDSPVLQQERHHYNMEGFFSPHKLPAKREQDFTWINNYFVQKIDEKWFAVSGTKLLEAYVHSKMGQERPTIPLLVSEPFPAKKVKPEILKSLLASGAEVEYLGSETLVLRGIPDWMNGFPLKEIFYCLLHQQSFAEIIINPLDWSQSTWEEMILSFSVEELLTKKIMLDFELLLKDKLK